MRLKIVHVISGLATGGAETMLLKLLRHSDTARFEHSVVSLSTTGPIAGSIRALGVALSEIQLGRTNGWSVGLAEAYRRITNGHPDVLQGWMPHGNIAALLGKWLQQPHPRLIWNVRMTLDQLSEEKRLTRFLIRLGGRSSAHADRIIYNSFTGMEQHARVGYARSAAVVIANGFDTEKYRPDDAVRAQLRRQLGIDDRDFLVGLVARYHPMKDHPTFVRALCDVAPAERSVRGLVVGPGCGPDNEELQRIAAKYDLLRRITFLDEWADTSQLYPALDALCVTSTRGESFPNAIGEAMSCGLPCVVTDIGDSARIVGECGVVVPPGRPDRVAEALRGLIGMDPQERRAMGEGARARVVRNYDLRAVVQSYESLYQAVVAG